MRKENIFLSFFWILLYYSCNTLFCQTNGSSIHLADEYFYKLDYEKSIEIYKNYLLNHENDSEGLWKIARVYVNYGEIPGNEKKEYFEKAKEQAEKCIKVNANCSEGYTFLAAAVGNMAFYGDNNQKIESSWKMVKLLNQALKINPNDHIALSIFGSLERMLANISWIERTLAKVVYGTGLPAGSYENAINYFLKAISIESTLIRHHYELGLVYREIGNFPKAKEQFEIALKCPVQLKADIRRLELIHKNLKEIE